MFRTVFVTTCKGRVDHLQKTLPKNLADNPKSKFVVLDYNDDDGLADYLASEHVADILSGRLVVYSFTDGSGKFRMAHAKNMAHRCGILEGAEILVTLDADNYAGLAFESYLEQKFAVEQVSYAVPDFDKLPAPGDRYNKDNPVHLGRGFAGRLAIRSNDFIKAGGYNERFTTWEGEDVDLMYRLERLGFKRGFLDRCYLNAIMHSSYIRFKEYPEARRFEENFKIWNELAKGHDTVVNYGDFGCGTVYRNFETKEPITLAKIPTRIFGIGMQRTATTSLHEALQILGYDSGHWKSGEWAKNIWQEMNKWGRSTTLEQDYALCDNPIPMLYDKLDTGYPGSKFILTIRNEDDWLRSIENLWSYEKNTERWVWDSDGFTHKMHGIMYGRIDFDPPTFLERYRRHNAEVQEYFADRPNDLLVMDIDAGAGWPELCAFLDKPVVNTPYPRANPLIRNN